MTTPNLPNKDAIAEQLDDILRGRTNSPACRYVPACGRESDYDYMADDIQALLTTTANARLEQFAAEVKRTNILAGLPAEATEVILVEDFDNTLKRFIGGTSE